MIPVKTSNVFFSEKLPWMSTEITVLAEKHYFNAKFIKEDTSVVVGGKEITVKYITNLEI